MQTATIVAERFNMPATNAQSLAEIVLSMSGQTCLLLRPVPFLANAGALQMDGGSVELDMAEAGIHMFMEKPISVRPIDEVAELSARLDDYHRKNGVITGVGYMLRYSAGVRPADLQDLCTSIAAGSPQGAFTLLFRRVQPVLTALPRASLI